MLFAAAVGLEVKGLMCNPHSGIHLVHAEAQRPPSLTGFTSAHSAPLREPFYFKKASALLPSFATGRMARCSL